MDVEADLVIALREVAGLSDKRTRFPITFDGVAFEVDYTGGSSSRLTLRARYDDVAHAHVEVKGREAGYRASAKDHALTGVRPMMITLRAENASDRRAKEQAISREHQTRDDRFDEVVYIDSPTTNGALLDAILREPVRAASTELLALGFDSVAIDDSAGDVLALLSAFHKLRDVNDAARRIARAFAALANGLPKVDRAVGEQQKRNALPGALAVLGAIALLTLGPIGFFLTAGAHGCTEASSDGEGQSLKNGCGGVALTALLVALAVGGISAVIVRALATPRLRGHSDSHVQIRRTTLAAFAWMALVAFLATALVGYAGRS